MLNKTFGLLILAALATGCCSKPYYRNENYEEEGQQYHTDTDVDSSQSEESSSKQVGYYKGNPDSQTYKLLKNQAKYMDDAFRTIKKQFVRDSSEENSHLYDHSDDQKQTRTLMEGRQAYPESPFQTFSSKKRESPYWKTLENRGLFTLNDEEEEENVSDWNKNKYREVFTLNDEEGESPYWKTLDNPQIFYSDEKYESPYWRSIKKRTRFGSAENSEFPYSEQYQNNAYYKSYFQPEQEYKYRQQKDSSEEADGGYYQREKQFYTQKHYSSIGMKPYNQESNESTEVRQAQKQFVEHDTYPQGRYVHNQQGTRDFDSDESNSAQDDDVIYPYYKNDVIGRPQM